MVPSAGEFEPPLEEGSCVSGAIPLVELEEALVAMAAMWARVEAAMEVGWGSVAAAEARVPK